MATQMKEVSKATALEGAVVETHGNTVIESLTRGEIDIQIATARQYPRSIKAFRTEAADLATLDQDTAASCLYSIPRDGKMIEGPSTRFAEIVANSYGNSRAGARIIGEEGDHIVAQGVFHDLEKNVMITKEVRRRITNRNGQRFSADMINVAANAACSIALRNAVLAGVPKAIWQPCLDAAKETAVGKQVPIEKRREKALALFAKMGIQEERVLAAINVEGAEDIGTSELANLLGIYNAIQNDELNIDAAFPKPGAKAKGEGKTKSERLADDLAPEEEPEEPPVPKAETATQEASPESLELLRGMAAQVLEKEGKEPHTGTVTLTLNKIAKEITGDGDYRKLSAAHVESVSRILSQRGAGS